MRRQVCGRSVWSAGPRIRQARRAGAPGARGLRRERDLGARAPRLREPSGSRDDGHGPALDPPRLARRGTLVRTAHRARRCGAPGPGGARTGVACARRAAAALARRRRRGAVSIRRLDRLGRSRRAEQRPAASDAASVLVRGDPRPAPANAWCCARRGFVATTRTPRRWRSGAGAPATRGTGTRWWWCVRSGSRSVSRGRCRRGRRARTAPSRAATAETESFAVAVPAGATGAMVISSRTVHGACSAAVGTFVVLTAGGWILTAAHLIQIVRAYHESARHHAGYRDNVTSSNATSRRTNATARRRCAGSRSPPRRACSTTSHMDG